MDLNELKRQLHELSFEYSQYEKEDLAEGKEVAAAIARAYSNAYNDVLEKLKEVEI